MGETDECCPHCGGTEGYSYSVRCYELRGGDWGKEAEFVDLVYLGHRLFFPRTVTCAECKERVRNPELAIVKERGVLGLAPEDSEDE